MKWRISNAFLGYIWLINIEAQENGYRQPANAILCIMNKRKINSDRKKDHSSNKCTHLNTNRDAITSTLWWTISRLAAGQCVRHAYEITRNTTATWSKTTEYDVRECCSFLLLIRVPHRERMLPHMKPQANRWQRMHVKRTRCEHLMSGRCLCSYTASACSSARRGVCALRIRPRHIWFWQFSSVGKLVCECVRPCVCVSLYFALSPLPWLAI